MPNYKSRVAIEALRELLPIYEIAKKCQTLDSVMIERLWRTIKYDDVYISGYEIMMELYRGLETFLIKCNARKH